MSLERNQLEEMLLKKRHEEELVRKELKAAEKKDKEIKENPILSLEEVIEQMGTGMIRYPDAPIRIRLVHFFGQRLSMPIPIDYLKRHTTEKDLVVLVNDAMGISLSIQLTTSEKKDVTFEKVKRGMVGQLKAAGIYIELLEEGEVEDEIAPTYFMTYRMPMAQGVMYHVVFYAINKIDGSMIIGDYNCFYKDVEKWENIMKATISYLDFH